MIVQHHFVHSNKLQPFSQCGSLVCTCVRTYSTFCIKRQLVGFAMAIVTLMMDFVDVLLREWNSFCFCFVSVLILYIALDYFSFVGPVPFFGIAIIPGYPVVGNFIQVLHNPAKVYMSWAKRYNCNVFQVRFGIKYVVVFNSFREINDFSIKNGRSLMSRPINYVFHNLLSTTQGFTVGSSPYGESYLKKKKVISSHLNGKSIKEYIDVLESESTVMLKNLISSNPELHCPPSCECPKCSCRFLLDIDLGYFMQLYVLKVALKLTYGEKYDVYNKYLDFSKEIIHVENQIIKIRSPTSSFANYFPFLRAFPNSLAHEYRDRRDNYINELRIQSSNKIAKNDITVTSSIIGGLIKSSLSPAEIKSICLTMISAGLDNTPLSFNHLMGHLSKNYGAKMQEKAYNNILTLYSGNFDLAWKMVALERKCIYVEALLLESMRYFTVLPLGLPRETTKDICYNGATIPRGTTVFFNLYSANHDEAVFPNPGVFDPERWIDDEKGTLQPKLEHLSFGLGGRKCPGDRLATMEMYILVCRLILLFKIKSPKDPKWSMELNTFKANSDPTATSFEPRPFKVRLQKRIFNGCDEFYMKLLDRGPNN